MLRFVITELVQVSLVVFSLLLLVLSLLYVALVVELVGDTTFAGPIWLPVLGFSAFPLLIMAGGRVEVSLRGRRYDLSRIAFLLAWLLAYCAARSFFGSAAHDLELFFDGSHGRFGCDDGYVFDGHTLSWLLFGVLPAAWWLLRLRAPAGSPRDPER